MRAAASPLPGRWSSAVFAAKVALLRLRRAVRDFGRGPRRLPRARWPGDAVVVAWSRTPLWSDARPAERLHQLGKVHNLRLAARALDGVVIPAGAVFSFWRQLGRASRARGFVPGRMLQQGCLVPAVGGGLCQLSNALYDAALQAGCAIVERHAHSRVVPGSAAERGRDATVAWNYVDLRFRPSRALRLGVELERDELVVGLSALDAAPAATMPAVLAVPAPATPPAEDRQAARSCATCAETGCFRHERHPVVPAGRTAFLLDEAWPEFVAHVAAARETGDLLGAPFPGRLTRGQGDALAGAVLAGAALPGAWRGLRVRTAAPGGAKRRADAQGTALVARGLARRLGSDVTRLCVAQSFLPHLWRDGHLGGRGFTVLMTRPPMHLLHARLDAAFAAHPDRATLGDHRAPAELAEWEAAALARAEAIVTPHAELAALFPGRAIKLDWRLPAPPVPARAPTHTPAQGRRIAFPGPTLARKGAYDLREAARALDLEVLLLGAELEGPGFWDGVRTVRPPAGAGPHGWLDGLAAVVQPALVEEQPRRLLAAQAAGVPVAATAACGLDGHYVRVAPLDPAGLTEALAQLLPDDGPRPYLPGDNGPLTTPLA